MKNIYIKKVRVGMMMMAFIAIFSFCAVPTQVSFAQATPLPTNNVKKDYTLLEKLPCIPGAGQTCGPSGLVDKVTLNTYIAYIFRLTIALAAFLAVFMFTIGAFQYMLTEAITSKADAKQRMWNSILGLLAVIFSYLILYTIDPKLVRITTIVPDLPLAKKVNLNAADTTLANNLSSGNTSAELLAEADRLTAEADNINRLINEQNLSEEDSQKESIAKTQELRDMAQELRAQAIFVSTLSQADSFINNFNSTATGGGNIQVKIAADDARARISQLIQKNLNSLTASSDVTLFEKMEDAAQYYNSKIDYITNTRFVINKFDDAIKTSSKAIDTAIQFAKSQIEAIDTDYKDVSFRISNTDVKNFLTEARNSSIQNITAEIAKATAAKK